MYNIAYLCPYVHLDAVDFSEWCSEEVMFLLMVNFDAVDQCCSQDQVIWDQDQDHTPRDQDQDREVQDQDQKSETKTSNFQDQDQDQRLLNWH